MAGANLWSQSEIACLLNRPRFWGPWLAQVTRVHAPREAAYPGQAECAHRPHRISLETWGDGVPSPSLGARQCPGATSVQASRGCLGSSPSSRRGAPGTKGRPLLAARE